MAHYQTSHAHFKLAPPTIEALPSFWHKKQFQESVGDAKISR